MTNLTQIIEKVGDSLHIELSVPLTQRGKDTYGEGEWEAPAVCVYINERMEEYALYHTQYLDYKDSLQATAPIFHFDSREEAEKVAEEFNLPVEFAPENDQYPRE